MIRALFLRDLQIGVRSGGGFGLGVAFYAIIALLFAFALGPEKELLRQIAPGLFWVAALLACLLSLDRLFQLDWEDGSLEHLLLSPMIAEQILLVKAASHWLINLAPLMALTPLLAIMYDLDKSAIFALMLSLIIGSLALSLIGAFGAALTVGLKRGGLLLSLLVLPLYVPSLIFGAEAARRGIEGNNALTPLAFLAAISLFALALMPVAGAQALRASMR